MNVNLEIVNNNRAIFNKLIFPLRVITTTSVSQVGAVNWRVVERNAETPADCWLIAGDDISEVDIAEVVRSALPLVLMPGNAVIPAEWLYQADGFILPDDDAAKIGAVLANAVAPAADLRVADLTDGVAQTINALSAEASRIAEQLAKLAEAHRADPAPAAIDARLVRRLLKLRRTRERYFPAEIFADPAWDMLLDLTAARLEGKRVSVSSLCIAAAVPTTTALRWIRSLTEAGLFVRYTDPGDARRSHVEIAEPAAAAMLGYLRAFSNAFAVR